MNAFPLTLLGIHRTSMPSIDINYTLRSWRHTKSTANWPRGPLVQGPVSFCSALRTLPWSDYLHSGASSSHRTWNAWSAGRGGRLDWGSGISREDFFPPLASSAKVSADQRVLLPLSVLPSIWQGPRHRGPSLCVPGMSSYLSAGQPALESITMSVRKALHSLLHLCPLFFPA